MAEAQTSQRLVRQIFAVLLIFVGVCLLFGIISFAPTEVWFPLLMVLIGILVLSTPADMAQPGGVILLVLGLYFFLRATDMISVPVLRYVFGTVILVVGVAILMRNSKGGDVPITKTFSEKTVT